MGVQVGEFIENIYPQEIPRTGTTRSLKSFREEQGLSVEELSEIIGFKEVVINDYERDVKTLLTSLQLEPIKDLAKALKISVVDIARIASAA